MIVLKLRSPASRARYFEALWAEALEAARTGDRKRARVLYAAVLYSLASVPGWIQDSTGKDVP